MPIEYSVNIAYQDIYDDYETVDVKNLLVNIPTKMALILVSHYTGQIHTQEKNPGFQLSAIWEWSRRFELETIRKIKTVINRFTSRQQVNFNFINNVSSLYLVENLIENNNSLPEQKDFTPQQEEDLFKAYLYFSAKWTKEQEAGGHKYSAVSGPYTVLVMMLPYSEIFEFKDFRIQFLKAVYFFKFCESNELFSRYLAAFLIKRNLNSWHDYLFNLVSVYIALLQKDKLKTVMDFTEERKDVFNSLQAFCVNPETFKPALDFLTLRETPVYKNSDRELLFLNVNFLVDKIYQSIVFDFADILITGGLTYKEKTITSKPQFFGIFGDEFIEPGLFFKVMKNIFRQKNYRHYTGDELKNQFGTITQYLTTERHLLNYLIWSCKGSDILLFDLRIGFIENFQFFLKAEKGLSVNSSGKHIKNLKKIIRDCVDKDWLDRDPFWGYKVKHTDPKVPHLSAKQLKLMEEKEISTRRLELVRDIFVFSCYTGFAYVDVANLKPDHVKIGVDGNKWLVKPRQKTGICELVPILHPAMRILSKYKDHQESKRRKMLLPVPSNQKVNAYLKELGDICGIVINLMFHMARHTFASTVALDNGVPIDSVSKMLGHRSIKTTQIYARVSETKISVDMQTLLNKFV